MMQARWIPESLVDILNPDDLWVIRHSGYGLRQGFPDHPALVIIDATRDFLGLNEGIRRSLKVHPAGVGQTGWEAVVLIQRLLAAFRTLKLPVVYTRPLREAGIAGTVRLGKRERARSNRNNAEIIDELMPASTELQIDKPAPSAFYQTDLQHQLEVWETDGIVVCGFTTSGCVRASVTDAASRGLKATVAADAVADRLTLSHWVSLLDIHFKYGDVILTDEILEYFDLPAA